jgi:thioredoxin-dependent peroxiredoxin
VIAVGQPAPAFEATDHKGARVSLAEAREKGPVVVYFYPKDFTPGCTREACMFRDAFADLDGLGATIVGVSVDDDESHRRFAERYQLPFSLVADPDRALAKRFGIARPLGLGASRATFVIDQRGIVRAAIHSELSMSRHVKDTKAALAGLV